MKTINFILTLLISSLCLAQERLNDTLSLEIIYNYNYQINKEDTLSMQSECMILKIGKHFSEYTSYNKSLVKEKLKEMAASGNVDMRNVPKAKLLYRVVKNFKNNETLFFNSFGTTKLFYKEALRLNTWNFINEEKEILGYKCKKATTTFAGRDYVAWYSEEISIPDGPFKFNGLPGLILSISDSKNQHSFAAIGIKKIKELYTLDFEKHVEVSKAEYSKTVKKIKEKPSLMAKTDLMQFSEEMLNKLDAKGREKFKYENNPIELTD